ncbi:hypothetical protein OGATHE_006292 [Ogataea polymorpha]|uniref:Uncharacterized protein n=1 Tax=Ogataea polymorpha TaxID=460523 RepID=A0A9P8NRP9_9ASCO|nr:hypothetical protein OGATHE_006292 [Ogataea polymorpha]
MVLHTPPCPTQSLLADELLSTMILGHCPPKFDSVFSVVMYVPPISGSAICVWKAQIDTNWIVDMKELNRCWKITNRKYAVVTWPSFGKHQTSTCPSAAAAMRPRYAYIHGFRGSSPVDHRAEVEREENGKTEKIAGVETDCLCRGCIAQCVLGQDREGPAVNGDVLCRTEQDEEEKGVCEGVEVFLHVAHERVDHRSQEQQRESGNRLDRDDPGASSAKSFQVARVDNGRP